MLGRKKACPACGTRPRRTRNDPGDFLALHHLAIMHSASAMDLEESGDFKEADGHWEQSLTLWIRLYENNEFWDHLADVACKNEQSRKVDELRDRFPQLLLKIHYDIAFHKDTPNHRARKHIRQARDAGLAPEVREAVQRSVVEKRDGTCRDPRLALLIPCG